MNVRAMFSFMGFAVALGVATAACADRNVDTTDFSGMALSPTDLPASPTNAVADDARASSLGRALFFDRGMSSDGTVGCVSCHDPEHGFSDPRARSIGVRGQLGDRHSMPITAAVMHPFLLWDGKADSAWSQPLKAIENPKEMDFTRVEVARRVSDSYRAEYEAVFGALPDLSQVPARAKPGSPEWAKMPEATRDDVQRVFANVGKAIEAYERKLLCADTRFDRWLRGEEQLTAAERAGAQRGRREAAMHTRLRAGPQRQRREIEARIGATRERHEPEVHRHLRRRRAANGNRGERVVPSEPSHVHTGEGRDQARRVGDLARGVALGAARHEPARVPAPNGDVLRYVGEGGARHDHREKRGSEGEGPGFLLEFRLFSRAS